MIDKKKKKLALKSDDESIGKFPQRSFLSSILGVDLFRCSWHFFFLEKKNRFMGNLPVGESAQGGPSIEDDEHEDVGHGGEEEEQRQEDVDEDADGGRRHRSFDVHGALFVPQKMDFRF